MSLAPQGWEDDEESDQLVKAETISAVAIAKSEVEAQLDAAHRYRRSLSSFRRELLSMATLSTEIAESCIYSLPRSGKTIAGPSVRLAEMAASAWGNIHVGCRIVDVTETEVVAQGIAWDLEKNLRVTVENRRRITDRNGNRFNEDMVTVTGNAAASIALRNAIFRVIPRAYIDAAYDQIRKVAIGNATTLAARRDEILLRLGKMGATMERVLGALRKTTIEDIGLEDMETLIGWGTAIKAGDRTVDDLFPAPVQGLGSGAPEGRRMPLGKRGRQNGKEQSAAPPPDDAPPPSDDDAPIS